MLITITYVMNTNRTIKRNDCMGNMAMNLKGIYV